MADGECYSEGGYMNFINQIKDRAKQDIKTIVLPESNDRRTLIAAAQILKEGLANIIMF